MTQETGTHPGLEDAQVLYLRREIADAIRMEDDEMVLNVSITIGKDDRYGWILIGDDEPMKDVGRYDGPEDLAERLSFVGKTFVAAAFSNVELPLHQESLKNAEELIDQIRVHGFNLEAEIDAEGKAILKLIRGNEVYGVIS